jgi:transposase-like protein
MSGEWKECKTCQSKNIVKNGLQDGVQRYKCKVCGGVFFEAKKQNIVQTLN